MLTLSLILIITGAVAALLTATLGMWKMRRVKRYALSCTAVEATEPDAAANNCVKASIIVMCLSDSDSLHDYLRAVTSQAYDDYEVIVVHEDTRQVNEQLTEMYSNICPEHPERLRFCFYQPGSHSLSRRKLALTIGMKAAKGEVALFTTSRCRIASEHWLAEMMRPFNANPYTEICLGYTSYDFNQMPAWTRAFRRFEFLETSSRWLSAAIAGKPYRGDITNLAIKRNKFFAEKGFGHIMHLENGEDDVYINRIAGGGNTAVVLSEDSRLRQSWGADTSRMYAYSKDCYRFTSQFLPKGPRIVSRLFTGLLWVAFGTLIAGGIIDLPDYIPAIGTVVVLAAMYIGISMTYAGYASAMGDKGGAGMVPLMWLWRPIANVWFSLRRYSQRHKNYTYHTRG